MRAGPIPARAGQPPLIVISKAQARAYPRSRGATLSADKNRAGWVGLSPLARGNRITAV